VTYHCGLRRFSEWVCLEHAGMARAKALRWWQIRAGAGDVPRTVEEALPLAWRLPSPTSITVDETNKYPEIVGHEFPSVDASSAGSSARGTDGGTGADAVPAVPGVPGWLVHAVEAARPRGRAA
jgi:DNA repair protein RadD